MSQADQAIALRVLVGKSRINLPSVDEAFNSTSVRLYLTAADWSQNTRLCTLEMRVTFLDDSLGHIDNLEGVEARVVDPTTRHVVARGVFQRHGWLTIMLVPFGEYELEFGPSIPARLFKGTEVANAST